MRREPGPSVRLKLTLSYAGFLMVAGALLLAVVWLWLLRYVPESTVTFDEPYSRMPSPHLPSRSDLVEAFVPKAAWALLALLAFGLVGGWLLAGRMLAPLPRLAEATRRAAAGSLSHRIALEGRRDEFRELADSFDSMLARLEAHNAEQQRFAANASHELRTPLAITQTLLDVARAGEHSELLDRLGVVNSRAIELTEALLLLSRADQRSFARSAVDLSLLVEEATETLLPLAEERGLTLSTSGSTSGSPASTTGSPALLQQLTTNLVHNAIVHNVPGGTVWVSTGRDGDMVSLTVENTGVVISAEMAGTLVEPFQRGAERTRTDHAGVGLGLAIVRSITDAHEGVLSVAPREGGGLCVEVVLGSVRT